MAPFDIHRARHRWNGCDDARPWLLLDIRPGGICGCFPISSHCYGGRDCFALDALHVDFGSTGLTKSCFVHYGSIIEIRDSSLLEFRGRLVNRMLAEFRLAAAV